MPLVVLGILVVPVGVAREELGGEGREFVGHGRTIAR